MKVSLKNLPDKPRGSAWPSSARAVRCPVRRCRAFHARKLCFRSESGNELDLYPQLLTNSVIEHIVGTALETRRKAQATIGLYAPNLLGYTRATMVRTMGCDPERGS